MLVPEIHTVYCLLTQNLHDKPLCFFFHFLASTVNVEMIKKKKKNLCITQKSNAETETGSRDWQFRMTV